MDDEKKLSIVDYMKMFLSFKTDFNFWILGDVGWRQEEDWDCLPQLGFHLCIHLVLNKDMDKWGRLYVFAAVTNPVRPFQY